MTALVLAIDTSGPASQVAWQRDKEGAEHQAVGPDRDQVLWQLVDRCLGEANAVPDLIAVSSGPGSYTGIRIGLAAAEGLSLGWKVARIAVPTFLAWAESVSAQAPVVCARGDGRGMVLWQPFSGEGNRRTAIGPLSRGEPQAVVEAWRRLSATLVGRDLPAELAAMSTPTAAPGALAVADWAGRHGGDLKDAPFVPIYLRPATPSTSRPADDHG